MNSRLFLAVIWMLLLALPTTVALAQDATESDPLEADTQAEPDLVWKDYLVKAYTIRVFGGMFGGDEYLNLPVKADRTYVDPESDRIMAYDGHWYTDQELDRERYDGPTKTIEDGSTFGLRLGTYLTDNFHLDLVFSYTSTSAILTLMDATPDNGGAPEEVEWDTDDDVKIYRGALEMIYDFDTTQVFGIYPYLGFGFGGIINRYTYLEDVSGLYLVGTVGIERHIMGTASAFAQFSYTTFNMSRDELHYTETVAYTDLLFGLSFFMDVVPGDVRATHDAEVAEARRNSRGH